jgi:hypothetical protein
MLLRSSQCRFYMLTEVNFSRPFAYVGWTVWQIFDTPSGYWHARRW